MTDAPRTSDRLCILVAVALLLSGCEQTDRTDRGTLETAAVNMAYFKDARGLCYASLSSTGYGGFRSVSITSVPCDKAGL